ncbi:MAG: adenylyl-sulfate kinase [Myxococcales bacterium]|nr:adenylyl-sulfate kinase [Myxococcales bacterium]
MKGWVVWVTGRPSSGKSTFAGAVLRKLRQRGRASVLLDGDEVRRSLVPSPGYSPEERERFYATLANLAGALARQGLVVLVAATAHRRVIRARARKLAPRFLEVYLDVSAEECARRDTKGLYARARAGLAPTLPGAGVRYEPPSKPEVVAKGGRDARAVEEVLERTLPRQGRAMIGPGRQPFSRRRSRPPARHAPSRS